jgi:hypothetical protein
VTGTVLVDGAGAPATDILLFAREPGARPRLLATGVTDGRGSFALEPDPADLPQRATVVAKLTDEIVGVLTCDVELPRPAPVRLEAHGPFYSVDVTIESDAGFPDELRLGLDPVRPEGVPEDLLPFLNQRAPGVFDNRYARRAVRGRSFGARVQRGVWRLGGEAINYDRPNIPAPDFKNYAVAAVRPDPEGAELPATPGGSVELAVDGDRRIALILREVPDDEL